MERRWNLKPGQTLENTKVSERRAELHITANAWNKITEKLDKRNLKAEASAKEQARRQRMREENQVMVDNWEDSLMVRQTMSKLNPPVTFLLLSKLEVFLCFFNFYSFISLESPSQTRTGTPATT